MLHGQAILLSVVYEKGTRKASMATAWPHKFSLGIAFLQSGQHDGSGSVIGSLFHS
jgi:hypothetical protein